MLRMARVMGEIGKPVHVAVMDALTRNAGYGDRDCYNDIHHN
jgi:hypothetical protein